MHTDAITDIQSSLISIVRRANDPRGNKSINRAAGTDIERAGAVMLARVEEHEPARLSLLAEAAGVDVSTASRQVARLVDEGYVTRDADPDDGRASAHRLTPAGRELRHRLATAQRAWLETVLGRFDSAERHALADLLGRFVAEVERAQEAEPPVGAVGSSLSAR